MVRSVPGAVVVASAEEQRLVIGTANQAEAVHFVMPRMGMWFPRQLSYEKWVEIGRRLSSATTSAAWCLGDWLVHGEENYNGRYRDAVEQSGLDYQTLRNYAWVTRRFDVSRRRDTLSFAHHAEVARLPEHEQDFWLRKADTERWSRNRLRREVRASLAERAASEPPDAPGLAEHPPVPAPTDTGIRVALSSEQMRCCRAAADRLGRSVEEWAVAALDCAARDALKTMPR